MRIYDLDGEPKDIPYDIQDMLRQGQRIRAIQALRTEFELGLREAKELKDLVEARLSGDSTFPKWKFLDAFNEIRAFLQGMESRIIALEKAVEIIDKRVDTIKEKKDDQAR